MDPDLAMEKGCNRQRLIRLAQQSDLGYRAAHAHRLHGLAEGAGSAHFHNQVTAAVARFLAAPILPTPESVDS